VPLFTRRGYDWTERYPAIAAAASKLLAKSFTLDREVVVCGADGVAVFDALHRRGKLGEAILQAFELLELNGEDFRPLSLGERKKRLARLLARVTPGIALCDSGPFGDWIKVKTPDSPAMIRGHEHFA
jgi:bifunctional non-homologous end joining protein LigD